MSNKPVKKFRIGYVNATVWENEAVSGDGKWYTVDFSRTYKDGDDKFQQSTAFGHADLPAIAVLAARAESWIAAQQ